MSEEKALMAGNLVKDILLNSVNSLQERNAQMAVENERLNERVSTLEGDVRCEQYWVKYWCAEVETLRTALAESQAREEKRDKGMCMHKIPLTEMELEGLTKHGLDTGTPSQLSDVFRLGVAFALEKVKDIQLGFRIVNSGGMWEVHKSEGGGKFSKLNAASSTIESIGISLDVSKLPSFTIIPRE